MPVGTLFQAQWRSDADRLSHGDEERHGVEYLTVLGPLTTALIGAQSAAVAGQAAPTDALTQAIGAVADVDGRLGGGLGTNERWADLRRKIEALGGRSAGDRAGAYDAYVEVTDLLLALYGKVRENSRLVQDPDTDAFFLQDGVAEELPEATVGLGRLADLALVVATTRDVDVIGTTAELIAAKDRVTGPAADLTEDFLLAVSGTESRTLSTTMLGRIDAFRIVMDKVEASAALVDGDVTAADVAAAATLRADATTAAAALSQAVLTELDLILEQRLSDVRFDRNVVAGAGGLAVLLTLVPIVGALVAWRRRARRAASRDRAPGLLDEDSGAIIARFPAWSADPRHPAAATGGRERSGAAR